MTGKRKDELIETVLVHVRDDRRGFLRHLLTAASAALTTPVMSSTAVAWWPEDECYYYERKVKKGKWPGEYRIEVKKKKCPPDEFWIAGKGKRASLLRNSGARAKARKAGMGSPINGGRV